MNKNVTRRLASLQLQGKNGHEQDLLAITSGDQVVIDRWSAPLTAEERTDRNNAIFNHWLAGETIEELADSGKMGHSQVANIINHSTTAKLANNGIVEQPPIYNVWNYSSCDPRFGQKHPGQIPGQAIRLAMSSVSSDSP